MSRIDRQPKIQRSLTLVQYFNSQSLPDSSDQGLNPHLGNVKPAQSRTPEYCELALLRQRLFNPFNRRASGYGINGVLHPSPGRTTHFPNPLGIPVVDQDIEAVRFLLQNGVLRRAGCADEPYPATRSLSRRADELGGVQTEGGCRAVYENVDRAVVSEAEAREASGVEEWAWELQAGEDALGSGQTAEADCRRAFEGHCRRDVPC